MAFVCLIDPADEVFHFDVFKKGSSWLVLTMVGYDDTDDKAYSAAICLEPMAGGWGDVEYTFCLIETGGESGTERAIWSGLETAQIIGKEDRQKILRVVLAATENLVNAVNPQRIFRCTWDEDSPPKALKKHYAIARVFESCGYEVHTADIWHGKRVWWMERIKTDNN